MPLAWRAPLGTEAAPGRPRAGSRERSSQPVASALDGRGRRSPIKWSSFVVPPEIRDLRLATSYVWRTLEAQHIHHPNVLVVADDPAELRAIEAALDVRITQVSRQAPDDLESFGSSPSDRGIIRGPPPPLPVNRPPSGEPPASMMCLPVPRCAGQGWGAGSRWGQHRRRRNTHGMSGGPLYWGPGAPVHAVSDGGPDLSGRGTPLD